ncbi:MAG: hypothetical protein JY451_09260 [Erythrobacter sp.]|nr:MAG: hypothetical protein JY451_09260 [Erythrobacter sp.]
MKHGSFSGRGAVRHSRHHAAHRAILELEAKDLPQDDEPVWFGPVVTAACYAKPTLHFATVRMKAGHQFEIKSNRCASFTFDERSPSASLELYEKVTRFLKKTRIEVVVLRTGIMRGAYIPHPFAFMAEAVLGLALGSNLYRVDAAAVANWLRKQEIELPEPEALGLPSTWRVGQQRTIEAGAYALLDGKIYSGEKEVLR